MKALCSPPQNKSSPKSNVSDNSSLISSTDISLDNLSSPFTSSSDDSSTESPALHFSNDKIEDDGLSTILLEQQMAWEDATNDTPADVRVESSLEPTLPLDQQMICDIQKIAGRLAAKANQLIGK